MSIPAIGAAGFTPMVAPTLPSSSVSGIDAASQAGASSGAAGADFGNLLSKGLENLQGLHQQADTLAVKAATGDLTDVHDYMIASTEASVATELTVAVRNKAVEAFNEIMRMQVG